VTRGAAETARGRPGGQHRRGLPRADATDYPERKRVTRRRPVTLAAGLGVAAGALLFLGYLRVSWTVAATSDGAAQALQARDMLAGNWLLHGWTVSDVSFYTTELPEYVLVELARPFGVGVIHVAGLALAVAGTGVALGRFPRPPGIPRPGLAGLPGLALQAPGRAPADLVDSVLAVAIVANLASYVLSIEPGTVVGTGYDAREIAAVLPLGAVLAGRVFGPKLAAALKRAWSIPRPARRCAASPGAELATGAEGRVRSGLAVVAVGLVLTGYGIAFAYSAAQPRAVNGDEVLADWLAGHGLGYGLGGASANVVTVDSGGRTEVAPVAVRDGRVRPLLYQSSAAAYDPRQHDATFLITGAPAARAGDAAEAIPAAAVRATFGQPARMYRFDGFTIEAWNVNLLTKMRRQAVRSWECSQSHMLEGRPDAACFE
jgi:hypothetical protein